jgi:isoleucyl-tRNA synthetase
LEALLDDLSNWYIRRSRRRFWKSEADVDKAAAYATLYNVLLQMAKLLAPFIPFTTETIFQNLVRNVKPDAPLSIHHTEWPVVDESQLDHALLNKMRLAINVAGLGRSARSSAGFKLRQPLAKARVNVGTQREQLDLSTLEDVLTEEINVKEIEIVSEVGELVNYKLLPNNRLLGPRFGSQFPMVRDGLNELDAVEAATLLQQGKQLVLEVDGQPIELSNEEVLVQTESRGGLAVASAKGITVAVDIRLTPELVQEGHARDLVRLINTMRKDAGLALDDRIHLIYETEGDIARSLIAFTDYIKQETLAISLIAGDPSSGNFERDLLLEGNEIRLALTKA